MASQAILCKENVPFPGEVSAQIRGLKLLVSPSVSVHSPSFLWNGGWKS